MSDFASIQIDPVRILNEKSNYFVDVDEISLGVSVLLFIFFQVPTDYFLKFKKILLLT